MIQEDSTEFVRKYDARIREAEELGRIQQQYGLNIKQSAEAESKLAGVQKQKAALDTIFNRPEMHLVGFLSLSLDLDNPL